jgi:DNA-binding transcriptional regulator YhcF (GntR family)
MSDALPQRIADDLRARIESGRLAPGGKLKSQRELAAEYARELSQPVSVSVIRAAGAILAAAGLIEVRQGKGTFVAATAGLPPARAGRQRIRHARAWPWNWPMHATLMFSFANMQPYLWLNFLDTQKRGTFTGSGMLVISVVIAVNAMLLLLAVGRSVLANLLGLAYAFSALTFLFSTLYWGYGEPPNFTPSLTHLDAIYFAVGTLTTAGTGNISALSEFSRGLQTTQMVLDFILVVFVVAVVIPRLIPTGETPKSGAVAPSASDAKNPARS